MLTEAIAELISEGTLKQQANMLELFRLIAELNKPDTPIIKTWEKIKLEPIFKDGYLVSEGINIVYENSVWYKMIRSTKGLSLQPQDGVDIHDKVINIERIAK